MRAVIVTGGSTHIGRAVAEKFASVGDRVYIASRDRQRLEAVASEIEAGHGHCQPVRCDVTDPDSVNALVATVLADAGQVDVMVCNAGGSSTRKPFPESDPGQVAATIAANLTGSYLCSQSVAEPMMSGGSGAIVMVGSIFGMVANDPRLYEGLDDFAATGPPYHAAKGGVIQLTRSLASRLGPHGVRVNCVSPGVVPRPGEVPDELAARFVSRTPLRRLAEPADIAEAVFFLAGDGASYITGHNLVVDGGWLSQ